MTGAEGDDADAWDAGWPCRCCGTAGVLSAPDLGGEVCPVCGWRDDAGQTADPDREDGANGLSLAQARANLRAFGAIDPAG